VTTNSSNRARQYARFIPSEEIDDVAQWQFTEVDENRRVAAMLAAQTPAEPVISPAMLEDSHQEGFQQGLEQGRLEASLEGQRRLDEYIAQQGAEARQRFEALLVSLEQRFADAEQVVAQGVLDVACELARQVVRRELAQDTAALRPVIREALGLLSVDARTAVVRLNPADHEVLANAPAGEFGSVEIKWVADPAVEPGGCLLEAAGAQVDGSLSRRWARAVANLGLDRPWADDAEVADVD